MLMPRSRCVLAGVTSLIIICTTVLWGVVLWGRWTLTVRTVHDHRTGKPPQSRDTGCLSQGQWVRAADSYGVNAGGAEYCPGHAFKHFCMFSDQSRARLNRIASWSWVPSQPSCPSVRYGDIFQRLLSRRVLFLGDSLTQEQFMALQCRVLPIVESRSGDLRTDITLKLQGGGMIRYVRLDHFIVNTTETLVDGWPYEAVQQADLVVLNTGLHKNSVLVTRSDFEAMARTTVSALFHNTHGVVAFRSHFMPRGDCAGFQEPLRNESQVSEWSHHTAYNWLRLPMMNDVWWDAFDLAGPRFVFYNITWATNLRADAHTVFLPGKNHSDCVHFCLPGVVDLWNIYMLWDLLPS